MKRKFFFLIFLSFVLLGFWGCDIQTKYSEGPFMSVFPAKDRVINTWEWAYALEDGVNRTGERADSTIEFLADGAVKICHLEGECREGSWNLITKKTKLQLVFGQEAVAYDIFMLKEKEMWLRYIQEEDTVREWELVDIGE